MIIPQFMRDPALELFEYHLGKERSVDYQLPHDPEYPKKMKRLIRDLEEYTPDQQSLDLVKQLLFPNNPKSDIHPPCWLEFDISSNDFNFIPGLFFDAIPIHYKYINDGKETNHWSTWLSRLHQSIPGSALDEPNQEKILSLVSILPCGSMLKYVGIMLPRKEKLKIFFTLFELKQVFTIVEKAGLILPKSAVERISSLLDGESYFFLLGMDLNSDTTISRIGIEPYVSKAEPRTPYLQRLLKRLVPHNLCTEEEKEMLLDWHQEESDQKCSEDRVKKINHIKVIYDREKGFSAKAYLLQCNAESNSDSLPNLEPCEISKKPGLF